MQVNFTHASRVLAIKPPPLESTRLVLTGEQPKIERLFARRFNKLTKAGELDIAHERLIDRRPVDMKPSTTQYIKAVKVKARSNKTGAYDHPLLTIAQRSCRTNTTKGEALDMTNKVAEQRVARREARLYRDRSKVK